MFPTVPGLPIGTHNLFVGLGVAAAAVVVAR